MEEIVNQMVAKVGIDKATAEKVLAFLKEHAGDVTKFLASNETVKGLADKLPGGLGSKLGF
jgi:hypothetical protein